MTTFKVHLADAPTDVVVYLAEHGPKTLDEVIAATSPAGAYKPHATVIDALVLLRDMGMVERVTVAKPYVWRVTRTGAEAVADAQAQPAQALVAPAADEPTQAGGSLAAQGEPT